MFHVWFKYRVRKSFVFCAKQTHLGYPGSSWEKVVLLGRYFCSPAKVHTSVTHSATFVLLTGRQTHRSDVTYPASFANILRHIISLVRCPPPVPSRKFYKLSPHITTHETWKHRDTESKKKQKTTFCWPVVCPSYSDQSRTLQRELLTVLSIVRGGVGVKEFRQP